MTTATESKYAELDAFIASLPIKYTATFVPQSLSRNAAEKHRSLNWRICIAPTEKRIAPLVTDYMQGIGHVPGHKFRPRSSNAAAAEYDAAEKGVYYKSGSMFIGAKIPAPDLRDVLYSLVLDSSSVDEAFEDWAYSLGYDSDSIKAEQTYRQCQEIAKSLRAIIGRDAIYRLSGLFQDY